MLAATLADGVTVLRNAAREPEISDLANCLNVMGADVKGAGSDTITITGVEKLNDAKYQVMADRIEAGTYAIAVAAAGGNVLLKDAPSDALKAMSALLRKAGTEV